MIYTPTAANAVTAPATFTSPANNGGGAKDDGWDFQHRDRVDKLVPGDLSSSSEASYGNDTCELRYGGNIDLPPIPVPPPMRVEPLFASPRSWACGRRGRDKAP